MSFHFDPIDHVYTEDHVVIPSVTDVLELTGIGNDFSLIPRVTLQHAAERGTYVHQCCEAYDAGELNEDAVHPECQGYVSAYQIAQIELDFKVHAWGKPRIAVKNGMKFGMTEDIKAWMRGAPWIIDVKCTAQMPASVEVQTAAYKCGLGQAVVSASGIETYDFVKGYAASDIIDPAKLKIVPWNRAALQLFPDATYKFDPHKDEEGDLMEWLSALFLVTRRNNRGAR